MDLQFDVLQPESCDGCGLCCEGIGSPVLVYASGNYPPGSYPSRPPGIPKELVREIDESFTGLSRGQEPQDRCLWFDPQTRRCKHYDWRPEVCRKYELGGDACLQLRRPYVGTDCRPTS